MGLKEKTASGIKWNTVATVLTMVIGIVQLAILTRLLDRTDFGLIAIATLVISFTDIFSELGITAALIHKQNVTREVYSSVYWLNIFMSVVLTLLVIISAPLIAYFYNEPRLKVVVSLLALKILFGGLGKMFQTIKIKKLEFKFISIVRILSSILGLVASIGFAYNGYGVMSLVFGQLITVGVNQSVYAIAGHAKTRIMLHFSLYEIKDVLKIGGYQLGTHILDFVASRLDIFLIGKFFSMEELGVYNIAKDLITKPFVIINSISSNVFSSAFSQIQNNLNLVVANFSKLLKTISALSIPLYLGMFTFADLIVYILYAPEFFDVARFLRLLTMVGIFSSLISQGGPLMIAKGRTDLGLRWTIVRIVMNTVILVLSASIGIYWVAIGQSFLEFISFFVYFAIVTRPLFDNYFLLLDYIKIPSTVFFPVLLISLPFILLIRFMEMNLYWQYIMVALYIMIYGYYLQKYQHSILLDFASVLGSKTKRKE